ncbi:hypothetical protein [Phenylobacterium ferrooxidans]|uniref:Uncharacterized protein n=1 Tax=Phenylobacterium ferrooxidans TaxID=2982689 RepID=A0ABW6CMJ8_9CAUL
MRVRLTQIALDHDGRFFAEGSIVEAEVDLPAEILEARLAADRAELVEDDPKPAKAAPRAGKTAG